MHSIGIAIVGFGVVGSGTVEQLQKQRVGIRRALGLDFEILYVVDKDLTRPRTVKLESGTFTSDLSQALADPRVRIVVEVIGGTTAARTVIESALKAGKHVVTANKALLAEQGESLFSLARECNLTIAYEASVCGGIPLIRAIHDGLAGDRIRSISGIVNGTSNYILTRMVEESLDYETALKRAREIGLAEADPTLDVDGHDAAHKIAILASLAFQTPVDYSAVHRDGIRGISLVDVGYARELGYRLKLLGCARLVNEDCIEASVAPSLVVETNELASVRDEYNAVLVESEFLGQSMYYGRGAGSHPTGNSVVADIIEIGRAETYCRDHAGSPTKWPRTRQCRLRPVGELVSRFYLRFQVVDQVGVLNVMTGICAEQKISIASVIQKEEHHAGRLVPVVILTHTASQSQVRNAVDKIAASGVAGGPGVMIRIHC